MAIKGSFDVDIEAVYRDHVFEVVRSLCFTLGLTNSACNVFLYTFQNHTLKKEWIKFVCGSCRKTSLKNVIAMEMRQSRPTTPTEQ